MGRGSPHCSRDPEKETEINRAHENPQQKISLWKFIQYIYETPEIIRSIFSTASCLQSDNDVSTSNSPPARNIVMICPDHYIETRISKYQNTTEFFFTQIWKTNMLHFQNTQIHSLFLQTHPWPSNHKHYSVFPSIILNPTPSTLININQKTNQRNT